ncbi:MAG: 6-phosphofructokinase [Anaerolineae bacterium]|nr:6-phosphofructokinase [Anaerolineae bacterium]
MKRIAVMTSGGDAPGMNAAIRSVVRSATAKNIEVFGIRQAYAGLLSGDLERLTSRDVSGILQRGGTILQTARNDEFKTPQGQRRGLRRLNEHGIDGLVVIGGDGSLRGAMALHKLGLPVVGIPGSIDNDIWGTDMCIGVDTALNTILGAIDRLRDTASSHERAFVIEVMGRSCGYLALMSGIMGGAEAILIPEADMELEEVARRLEDAYLKGKNHAIAVVAEGAKHSAADVAKFVENKSVGFEVRLTILGHLQRGGSPTAYDRLLASRMGIKAVSCLAAGQYGVMVALHGREMATVTLEDVTSKPAPINMDDYEMAEMLSQ